MKNMYLFRFMGYFLLLCVVSFIPHTVEAYEGAGAAVDIEAGLVIPGYNDVAIPGSSGTRFSLTEELEGDYAAAFRFRYSMTFAEKHWVGILAAPLTVKSSGTLDRQVDFYNTSFPKGNAIDATFRFDSYRLLYRYLAYRSDRLRLSIGGALKVRDASIKLESQGLKAEKKNTGIVPLLSFNLTWTPAEKTHFIIDGEALAAPQGRAEDVLFAAQYDINDRFAFRAGYRILEGGADNDEVYTFSMFHYIIAGATWSF